MARDTLRKVMPDLLRHEGGYVNHPKDPGGETNMGITARTLDRARRALNGMPRTVRDLTVEQATRIYAVYYWAPIKADEMPAGPDYVTFDAAVNSGPGRGVQWTQMAARAKVDGVVGPNTLKAIRALPPALVVERACDYRRGFLRGLRTFATFGKGWNRRVDEVEAKALELCGETDLAVKRADVRVGRETARAGTVTAGGGAATVGTTMPDLTSLPDWAPWAVGVVAALLFANQVGRVVGERRRRSVLKEV